MRARLKGPRETRERASPSPASRSSGRTCRDCCRGRGCGSRQWSCRDIRGSAGEPRRGAGALELLEMAAGTADRMLGSVAFCASLRRARLAKVRPRLLRKIFRDRQHVVLLERGRDRLHGLVLAIAALEVAKLDVDVAVEAVPRSREWSCRPACRRRRDSRRRPRPSRQSLLAGCGPGACADRDRCDAERRNAPIHASIIRSNRGSTWKRGPVGPASVHDRSPARSIERKAMMLLPRLKLTWVLPPAPTTMYCLPPTM